jgi:hypothetical protein
MAKYQTPKDESKTSRHAKQSHYAPFLMTKPTEVLKQLNRTANAQH